MYLLRPKALAAALAVSAMLACQSVTAPAGDPSTTPSWRGPARQRPPLNLGQGAVASVTGSIHHNDPFRSPPHFRTAAIHAVTKKDGTVNGKIQIKNHDNNLFIHADLNCVNVVGNAAYVTGVITGGNLPAVLGWAYIWKVVDNGPGGPVAPDSWIGGFAHPTFFGTPGDPDMCRFPLVVDGLDSYPLFATVSGNVQVRGY